MLPAFPALPRVGLGTFRSRGPECHDAVAEALRCGIRHIDTAAIYRNEVEVGAALAQSGLQREEVFITSKVSPYQQGEAKAREACEGILERLGTHYVDLVLIHWPGAAKTDPRSPLNSELRRETWHVLEEYFQKGRFKAIGVSNYSVEHLQELLGHAQVRPAVNQVELHPRWQQPELREFCAREGIGLVAYASLGVGELLKEEAVLRVAEESGMTPAQVLLVWGLQKGYAVIPKSVSAERIRQFAPEVLLSLSLTESQMAALDALGQEPCKYCWDPAGIL